MFNFLFFKKTIIIITAILIACGAGGFFYFKIYPSIENVKAGAADNTSGFAWSDNIGWISFNNTSDGSLVNYGVNIDSVSGDLSGYGWSDNIGWVSFNRSDTGNPPEAPFNSGNPSDPIAKYNSATGALTGWMRVLAACKDNFWDDTKCTNSGAGDRAGGWDGWIRFCDTSVVNCSAPGQIARIESNGDWRGWGWSNIVVGWVSFNCLDGGDCANYDYKVTNSLTQPPTASDFSNPPAMNVCGTAYASFSWTYNDPNGDSESQFQLQVARDSGFTNLLVDRTVPSTVSPGEPNSQTVFLAETCSGVCDRIPYGSVTYYWRVQVFDAGGTGSGWSSTFSFSNQPIHAYPVAAGFSWNPPVPSQDEIVTFYPPVQPPAVSSLWSWTIPDAQYVEGTDSSFQNPKVQFSSGGAKIVVLTVTDSDHSYNCSAPLTVSVSLSLPKWKEVAP